MKYNINFLFFFQVSPSLLIHLYPKVLAWYVIFLYIKKPTTIKSAVKHPDFYGSQRVNPWIFHNSIYLIILKIVTSFFLTRPKFIPNILNLYNFEPIWLIKHTRGNDSKTPSSQNSIETAQTLRPLINEA